MAIDVVTLALAKNYVNKTVEGLGALEGKSAYEVAVDNGFEGTEAEWLKSLIGISGLTPHIGANGNWWLGEEDTGAAAVADYEKIENKPTINGVELSGDLTLEDLNIAAEEPEEISDNDIMDLFK